MHDLGLILRASDFHPWDAIAPAALSRVLKRGPFRSVETGCGGSTIVLSHASDHHTVFAIEGKDRTIAELRKQSDLRTENVTFVEGETKDTLPRYQFEGEVDFVLLDGPHAYPLPQIELAHLFPRIRLGGWLVMDDILHFYDDPYNRYLWTWSTLAYRGETQGWIIGETYCNDPTNAQQLNLARQASGNTVFYLAQWPLDRSGANWNPPADFYNYAAWGW